MPSRDALLPLLLFLILISPEKIYRATNLDDNGAMSLCRATAVLDLNRLLSLLDYFPFAVISTREADCAKVRIFEHYFSWRGHII